MAYNSVYDWLYSPYLTEQWQMTHRRMLVITGTLEACQEKVKQLEQRPTKAQSDLDISFIIYNELADSAQANSNLRKHLLGNEYDVAVMYCHHGFSPSDVLALTGTLRYGGCLILCCPNFDTWHLAPPAQKVSFGFECTVSHGISRWINYINHSKDISLWGPNKTYLAPIKQQCGGNNSKMSDVPHSAFFKVMTPSQHTAYGAWSQNTENKAVITAPRGRGKSALMGIICADTLKRGQTVFVTSTVHQNVANLFKHCKAANSHLEQTEKHTFVDKQTGGVLKWMATDNPKLINHHCDLLVVDEAASLPIPILTKCVAAQENWLLGTTLHGYEGSGRGFVLRLLPKLQQREVPVYHLNEPLRWVPEDSLETITNTLCLFDSGNSHAQSLHTHNTSAMVNAIQVIEKPLHTLSEPALQQVMQLLSLAHYQTTPDDQMRLLDSHESRCFLAFAEKVIVGVAVIHIEGGERLAPLAVDIANGLRRPQGHLSAQKLATITGLAHVATHLYWRINRIAVHPDFQNKGLGSHMVSALSQAANAHQVDCLTSSYGQSARLNKFWKANGFTCVEKGDKVNKASGERSALIIKPVSKNFEKLADLLACIFQQENHVPPTSLDELPTSLKALYTTRLNGFTRGIKSLEQTAYALACLHNTLEFQHLENSLNRFVPYFAEGTPQALPLSRQLAFHLHPLDKPSLRNIFGCTNNKALVQTLREYTKHLLFEATFANG